MCYRVDDRESGRADEVLVQLPRIGRRLGLEKTPDEVRWVPQAILQRCAKWALDDSGRSTRQGTLSQRKAAHAWQRGRDREYLRQRRRGYFRR
jgi:hypothetical protein